MFGKAHLTSREAMMRSTGSMSASGDVGPKHWPPRGPSSSYWRATTPCQRPTLPRSNTGGYTRT